jgi:DNA-binding MarR family transcriptional regulator
MRATRDNLGFLLAKATQRWNELLAERFAREGYADVRPSYGSLLVPLFEEDGLRMSELAARARLSKQTMTTMVRLLERDGLVRRTPHPSDRRATLVHLTPRARAFQPVVERVLGELDALVRTALTPADNTRLKAMLKGVIDLEVPHRDHGPARVERPGVRVPLRHREPAPVGDRVRTGAQGGER